MSAHRSARAAALATLLLLGGCIDLDELSADYDAHRADAGLVDGAGMRCGACRLEPSFELTNFHSDTTRVVVAALGSGAFLLAAFDPAKFIRVGWMDPDANDLSHWTDVADRFRPVVARTDSFSTTTDDAVALVDATGRARVAHFDRASHAFKSEETDNCGTVAPPMDPGLALPKSSPLATFPCQSGAFEVIQLNGGARLSQSVATAEARIARAEGASTAVVGWLNSVGTRVLRLTTIGPASFSGGTGGTLTSMPIGARTWDGLGLDVSPSTAGSLTWIAARDASSGLLALATWDSTNAAVTSLPAAIDQVTAGPDIPVAIGGLGTSALVAYERAGQVVVREVTTDGSSVDACVIANATRPAIATDRTVTPSLALVVYLEPPNGTVHAARLRCD